MAGKIRLEDYLDRLAAKTPAPGGGSAAALAGALGTSLLSMAAQYTLSKAKTAKARNVILSAMKFSKTASHRLRFLMGEDEKVYRRLAGEIKKKHPKNILRLYKNAINVPMEVCEIAVRGAEKSLEICDYCRTYIISDVIEAAILCEAAFLSAKLNVQINLCSIENVSYVNRICKQLKTGENRICRIRKLAVKKLKNSFRRRRIRLLAEK